MCNFDDDMKIHYVYICYFRKNKMFWYWDIQMPLFGQWLPSILVRQNGSYFADIIFKFAFSNENDYFYYKLFANCSRGFSWYNASTKNHINQWQTHPVNGIDIIYIIYNIHRYIYIYIWQKAKIWSGYHQASIKSIYIRNGTPKDRAEFI